MQRYFASIINKEVILNQDDVFHLTKVMRAKVGENIEVVDNNQKAYLAVINSVNPLSISIQEPILKNSELSTDVTLFFALAKSDKIELVIQKATELGANKIVLFQGMRSVVKFSEDDFKRKLPRYQSIAKEAAEQCHRELIPQIEFINNINAIDDKLCELNLFAYELEAGNTDSFANLLTKEYKSISVIIGPEGGFDEKEANKLLEYGFKPISLGKRILRCETASIYALSVLSFNLEK